MMGGKREEKPQKIEFSKVFGILLTLTAVGLGVWILKKYFFLTELAITSGAVFAPDVALAVAAVTAMLVPNLAYEAYQGFLKNSRNKHGVDRDGYRHQDKNDCFDDEHNVGEG